MFREINSIQFLYYNVMADYIKGESESNQLSNLGRNPLEFFQLKRRDINKWYDFSKPRLKIGLV